MGEAIESALSQTYANIEIIVVDDGSTDGSLDVIRSCGNRVLWETGPNRGGGAARNRGLALARGELVQFLDADDLLFPEKLAKQVPVALENGPGVIPICDWDCVDEIGIGIESRSLDFRGEDAVVFCLRNELQTASPLHWKKDLDKIGGFDELLPCSQERDLHLRLACEGGQFTYIPEVFFQYRLLRNGVSADYGRVLHQHGRIFSRAYEALQSRGQLSEARARVFAWELANDARRCLRRNDTQIAKEYFSLADSMHREGALRAFGRPALRVAARIFGMAAAERLFQLGLRLGKV